MEGSFDLGWMIGKVFQTPPTLVPPCPLLPSLPFPTDGHSMSEKAMEEAEVLGIEDQG